MVYLYSILLLSVEIDHFVEKSVVIQSWETRTIKIKIAFHNGQIFSLFDFGALIKTEADIVPT